MTTSRPIGPKEARVLAVLVQPLVITEVTARLEDEGIDDASVYLALKRLLDRGLVTRRSVSRTAADGKVREVGEYAPEPQAMEALRAFYREMAPVVQRIAATAAMA